jgi:tetratricopeptide (TPR) repeat protein
VNDEQPEVKKSRRAQRREATGGASDAEPSADRIEEAGSAETTPEGADTTDAAGAVREANRQARRAAAAKRRTGRDRQRERAAEIGLDTGEMVDDAVARGTDAAVRWLRRNFNVLQWIIVIGVAGWIAWEIYSWREARARAQSSDVLARGLHVQRGKIGDPSSAGDTDIRGFADTRPVFASADAQLAKAEAVFREAKETRPGKPIAVAAQLSLAGVLHDQGKHADARAAYEAILASPVGEKDPELRGRALEGLALVDEAEGKVDAAIKRYKELENADISGFTPLARYQHARLLSGKGDREGAIALLKKVRETTKPSSPMEMPSYVSQAALALLEELDPEGASESIAQKAVQDALEQLQLGKEADPVQPSPVDLEGQ